MDGYEATKKLRELIEEGKLPKVPIVALTANHMEDIKEKAAPDLLDDVVEKPIN
eukprot:CAMPEP_0114575134 /NCGR_PEP_ID=MMETSP0125-20121206/38_1 /TAXON_ID=485358 ORGANISM="Aristerostoma sp., Strain ATCC 50986" /NCGR_SAMPLE_ID=MMETSP0125 /ASSEMBLY_ACC=CAM_ASM_000245 /LENGTH=53 /DNA_ID=CAMNT_0001762629 /DNA_START=1304 /DNA_END=1465 /DNA_ORIENTATION=+